MLLYIINFLYVGQIQVFSIFGHIFRHGIIYFLAVISESACLFFEGLNSYPKLDKDETF